MKTGLLEHVKECFYTVARYVSKGSESEWLWVSHSPKERFSTTQAARQEVEKLNNVLPVGLAKESPYFVIHVQNIKRIERV